MLDASLGGCLFILLPKLRTAMSLALASSWLKSPGAASGYLTSSPQISFFLSDNPRHFPYSFLYKDTPAKENSYGYGRGLTFALEKDPDLLGQCYLRMQVSKVKYCPIRDNDILRACSVTDLPSQPSQAFGGLSILDAAPSLIDYMGWLLMESAELYSSTTMLDRVRGDYLFLAEDMSKDDASNRILSLAPNCGGANNLGYDKDQTLYVPLSFFCGKGPESYYPICKLHHADLKVKVKIGPAPFRGDATGFQVDDLDADTEAEYAAENGPDILPHQMYERYMLLRKGAISTDFAIKLIVQNDTDRSQGTFVPQLALQIQGQTTQDRSLSDNVIQLIRRKSYTIDTTGLQCTEAALVNGNATTFVWDYANTPAAITCTGQAKGDMIRLYGTLSTPGTQTTITYQGGSFKVHVTLNGTVVKDTVVAVPPSASSTWEGGAGLPILDDIVFRIDPARIAELAVGDSFAFQLTNAALPVQFTVAASEGGAALPATYLQRGDGSISFQYSAAMSTDRSLALPSLSPPTFNGFSLPSWVQTVGGGNLLYYHLGTALPANARGALSGVIVGAPADNQSFDYLRYDPGAPVDAAANDGTLQGTGANGLFPPFFPQMPKRPAFGAAPRGVFPLPVYCYNVSNGDNDVADYTPITSGSTIARFASPNSDVGGQLTQCSLLTTAVYLSDEERLPLQKANYKQLMQQTQSQEFHISAGALSPQRYKLNFTGPTRELLFYFRPDTYDPHSDNPTSSQHYWDWTCTDGNDFYDSATIYINNAPMHIPARDPTFFQYLMPSVTHSSIPKQRVSCIPFAITGLDGTPPVGDIDLSAYDAVDLVLTFPGGQAKDDGTLVVFARSENVVTLQNGMSGLVFQF